LEIEEGRFKKEDSRRKMAEGRLNGNRIKHTTYNIQHS
jgi:hypothetical protein